jgi:hypothetical protein
MKIQYKLILFAFVILGGISSCEIDRFPETNLSDPSFWKTENDIKLASNYLYTFLPGLPQTSDVWSDDAFGREPNPISDGTRLVPATDGSYNTPYVIIRAANNILLKAPLASENGVDPAIVAIYLAEARFFRAWAYFSLVQRYGDVPLILETLIETDEQLYAPKSPRSEVVDAIYDDLNFAIKNLKSQSQLGSSGYGRVTNTAALAFKSRVALFEGTFAKYHGKGDAQKHLKLAQESAKACIESGRHGLYQNYFGIWQYEGEGPKNPENILVRQYGKDVSETILFHNSQRSLETGAANPTKALVDSYLMKDGLPISKSPLYQQPKQIIDVFANRDKRLEASLFKKGDEYIGTQPAFNVPNLSFQRTGFANRRYANLKDWQNSRSFIDYPIIRYAEVLLNYAEAVYELNGQITDGELNLTINALRNRANVAPLSNSFALSNGLNVLDEIRRERRVELALEGFRYWDLIRWKTAEVELPKPVLGNFYFAKEFGTAVTPDVNENGFIILQRRENRSFDANKDYLWPFPVNELGLNPSLKQNPGWQ